MKKLALFLLTIFTMSTAAVCGCGSIDTNSHDNKDKVDTENVQMRTVEEGEQIEPENPDDKCPDDEKNNGECPNKKKRDDKCPKSRRPNKRHNRKSPHPESVYRKHR